MPFYGTISNQTAIRSGASVDRHVIIHTPDVVLQCQPLANSSATINDVISITSVTIGAVTDALANYTVFVTPSSDYKNDLQYRQDECLTTYARLDGSGINVYIGKTTFQWTTSQYVTVVKDVRVFQRKEQFLNKIEYHDSDITYRTMKPRIEGLYTEVLEITSGSTVSKAFAPTVEAMFVGGVIDSYSWDTDGNTISTGTSTDLNITVDFTAGTHLVSLTVTDNALVIHKLSVLIAVIPADWNSVLETGIIAESLSHNENGHSVVIRKLNDIEPILPGSMAIVCSKIRYGDGTSTLITDMVGWIGETSQITLGDETYQRTQSATIELLDIGFFMDSIVVQPYPFIQVSAPTKWSELARVTPLDMLWYILSEFSTVPNVASVAFPSGYKNQTIKELVSPGGTLMDVSRGLAFSNYAGAIGFAPHGDIVLSASLPYATDTVRDAASTVISMSTQDCDLRLAYPPIGIRAVQYVNAGTASYNTTFKEMQGFYGRAPGEEENGLLEESVDSIVLPENTSGTNSIIITGQLAYYHWDASNENLAGSLSNMLAGYITLRQRQDIWLTLDISEADMINSDITFDSTRRFIITGIEQSYNHEEGSLYPTISIRAETGENISYSILSQQQLASLLEANNPLFPPVPIYPLLDDGVEESDIYGDEYADETAGSIPPGGTPSGNNNAETINQPSSVFETISVPLTGETVTTANSLVNGTDYLITITGAGKVGDSDSWNHTFDFTVDEQGWQIITGGSAYANAVYTSGVGWQSTSTAVPGGTSAHCYIERDFTSTHVDSWSANVFFDDIPVPPPDEAQSLVAGSGLSGVTTETGSVGWGATGTSINVGQSIDGDLDNLYIVATHGDEDAVLTITSATASGTGTNPFGGENESVKGDAFYSVAPSGVATSWGANGLQMGGSAIAGESPDSYSPSHEYYVVVTGSNNPLVFNFVDGDSSYAENTGAITVKIKEIL